MIALIIIAVVVLLAILVVLPAWLRQRRRGGTELSADHESLPSKRERQREVANWQELNDPRRR